MLIGYARISTQEQNLELQLDALKRVGCSKIFTDTASGSQDQRPGLQEALGFVRAGDTLVVWRLDRLGRSLKHLLEVVNNLNARRVGFQSLQETIDTTSAGGKLIFAIFGALAEFERDLIRTRTMAGLSAARARGRFGGRPKKLNDKNLAAARALLSDKSLAIKDVCETVGVSRATLYRSLMKQGQ